MSSHDINITCRRCHKEFPMREMHYDKNGRDLICSRCACSRNDIVEQGPATKKQEEYVSVVARAEKDEEQKHEAGKQRYYCVSCRYIFLRNHDVNVDVCPYCDKATVRKYLAKSSDDLLKESEYIFD